MTEKQIESQILDWLNLQPGIFAFKVNTTGVYDTARKCFRTIKNPHIHKGTSDIIGCKNGRFFAIEVKTPKAHKKIIKSVPGSFIPSSHEVNQAQFLCRIMKKGGFAMFASSLDKVISFIKSMDSSTNNKLSSSQ
jgi:hypothetical protein